jgi:hypothetical protein
MIKKFIIGILLGATVSAGHAVDTRVANQEDTAASKVLVAPAKSQDAVPEGQVASPGNIMVKLVHSKAMGRLENVLALSTLIIAGLAAKNLPDDLEDKAFGVVKIGVGVVVGLKVLQYIFPQDDDKGQAEGAFLQKAWKSLYSFAGHAPTVGACALSMWAASRKQQGNFYYLWGNPSMSFIQT